jgi:hypothetical protein
MPFNRRTGVGLEMEVKKFRKEIFGKIEEKAKVPARGT